MKSAHVESHTVVDMHRLDIVCSLHKKGLTIKSLSLEAGLAAGTLSKALDRPWTKGERIIAEALEMKPQDIWPTRYENTRYEIRAISMHS
ncbi:transcriptional regulator [Shewanella psychropiezotolerans]|uniref:Transcriptional regulator n=1 Tax=Shewanella psychropiezotolerans TaxID=2593655 RepID=A0ABX5WXP0_9GAMM|nr:MULTISPECIES: helix-turn-helix transcriptional regulator [Shewanella]MPY22469.1 transcriptional regulator [Shewanella sp. YLB-07]MPY22479.1 transcriptional regulator [Shewanella sp. YLB-07]QDO83207.1 transcriptional regulator [Shewanella psychropiezotolerans]QDO83218.1 transcriptional regulator [Shewanella psychropiezotolerans]